METPTNSLNALLHLVYLRSGDVLISKKPYSNWREIQDEYDDFMTSLGPWSVEELLSFLEEEYGSDAVQWGVTRRQIETFLYSAAPVLQIT